jgi:hypothetical protein
MQIQIDALEQVLEVENAIATAFEDFDLVVEAFAEAAVLSLNEVVGDFVPPGHEQFQEIIERLQAAFLNLLYPSQEFGLRS